MSVPRRSFAALFLSILALAGCTFPPLPTPTPTATPSPSPTPTPTPTPTHEPTPTPEPTPDLGDAPAFAGGELVTTAMDALRVRQRPSLSGVVITGQLPIGSELEIVMGPIPADGAAWYLVRDADADGPEFSEGWVAAGYEPEPFLVATGRTAEDSRVVAAYSFVGDAEYGPVRIPDEHHLIRWVAVDPRAIRCTFSVMLAPGDDDPVSAIRATIGDALVPGTLQPTFFAEQRDVRGQVFVTVQSTCAWSLAVIRVDPPDDDGDDDDERPSPTPADD